MKHFNTFLGCLFCSGAASAIEVLNYSSATNDRFANDPSFVGSGYDWSGVGRTSNGRWGTLLGDNYFITANHFEPSVGQNVTFVDGNSLGSTSHSYAVAGRIPIAGTDLVISYFNEAVDSAIARYGFAMNPANSVADLGLGGVDLFTMGDQVAGVSGNVFDQVVAQNQAESWFEEGTTTVATPESSVTFGSAAAFDQIVLFENEVGDTANNITTYESQLQAGDSGSPLFSVSGGDLFLQGIAYAVVADPNFMTGNFVDTAGPFPIDPLEQREATFYSYTGSYSDDLKDAIDMVPFPIPEPSTSLFLLGAGALFLRRKR